MTDDRLHHVVTGPADAPVVLLGGSLGTTQAMWARQVAVLSRDYRVIAFDHRGHGASPVPPGPYAISDLGSDVVALLDSLGIERASYVGLSIGGMVGMWLAAHAPRRISRLAVLCTSAHLPPEDAWRDRAATVLEARSTAPIADAVLERWLTPAWAAAHPDELAALRRMLLGTPAGGYAACCAAIGAMDLRPELPAITAPTLVVTAAQDRSTPPIHGQRIAAAIAGAHHKALDPAAHLVSVEQADAVTALVADHLEAP